MFKRQSSRSPGPSSPTSPSSRGVFADNTRTAYSPTPNEKLRFFQQMFASGDFKNKSTRKTLDSSRQIHQHILGGLVPAEETAAYFVELKHPLSPSYQSRNGYRP